MTLEKIDHLGKTLDLSIRVHPNHGSKLKLGVKGIHIKSYPLTEPQILQKVCFLWLVVVDECD